MAYVFNKNDVIEADHWSEKFWLVRTLYGVHLVGGDCEQTVIDNLVDSGEGEAILLEPNEIAEYQAEGWDITYAGNYCLPVTLQDVSIELIDNVEIKFEIEV